MNSMFWMLSAWRNFIHGHGHVHSCLQLHMVIWCRKAKQRFKSTQTNLTHLNKNQQQFGTNSTTTFRNTIIFFSHGEIVLLLTNLSLNTPRHAMALVDSPRESG